MENSERDGNTRPPDLPFEKFVCRSGSNSYAFLELSCFSHDPADVGHLLSGSSAFSQTSLNIWKFMVHILLKPGLENFEQLDHSEMFTELYREEKKEAGDRGGQKDKRGK